MQTNNKLREAVELAKSTFETLIQFQGDEGFVKTWAGLGRDAMIAALATSATTEKSSAVCDVALSAPPRNCDVGTVEEQFARFRKFCKKGSMDSFEATAYCAYECPCGNNYDCKLAWAQMPYEEGAAK